MAGAFQALLPPRLKEEMMRVAGGLAAILLTISAAGSDGALITQQAFNSDADCGINSTNVYTHAIDAGNDAPSTVNGVSFTGYMPGMSLENFSYGNGSVASSSDAPLLIAPDQQVYEPMYRFIYGHADLVGRLSGLTPGLTYEARVYLRSYSSMNRLVNIAFDEDGAGPLGLSTGSFNEDDARTRGFQNKDQPYWIGYRYTAASSSFEWTPESLSGDSFHFYAFTNQVVPEPTSISLAVIAFVMTLGRPRRRNCVS